jgi:hypothetical protein
MKSIFTDKDVKPTANDLKKALGKTFQIWKSIEEFMQEKDPKATSEWNYSGEKYGWSFRIKDKKRVLVYLLPRDMFFKVAFAFGQKATDQIMQSDIAESIKTELQLARAYAEGRGIRIDVKDASNLEDIRQLIRIKLAN